MKGSKGFTLIELMVVVVIVAILAAVAMPSYNESVKKAHQGSAKQYMMELASREQRYFMDARSFAAAADASSVPAIGAIAPTDVTKYYTVKITTADGPPPTFLITATPKTVDATNPVLTLSSDGTKTPADKW